MNTQTQQKDPTLTFIGGTVIGLIAGTILGSALSLTWVLSIIQ